MVQTGQPRLRSVTLFVQPRIGIGGRLIRFVGSRVAVEVGAVAIASVFLAEALLRSPSLDQGAVHGEVIVGDEPFSLRGEGCEELLRHVRGQQTVAFLRKHRMVPHRIVHAQADELAEQQVTVQLLDQMLRADRVERLQQQQRPQHPLRCDRWPPLERVQALRLIVQQTWHHVRYSPNLTQRMVLRHTLLQRRIAVQPALNPIVSTHHFINELSPREVQNSGRPKVYFNKLLGKVCLFVPTSVGDTRLGMQNIWYYLSSSPL